MGVLELLRVLLGAAFVLFVPGLAWSYVFFARKSIDWIERVAVSVGLSIAIVPLAIFWLNRLFHMGITLVNTSATVMGLIVLAGACILATRFVRGRNAARETSGAPQRDDDPLVSTAQDGR